MRLFVFFIGLSFVHLRAQSYTMDTTVESKVLASAHYATGWTGGDLVNRYGYMNLVGFSAGYKLKNNWFFQTDASFLFGSQVKIPGLLNGITDSYGNITDVNGDPAAVNILCRGVTANVVVGKIIPLSKFHRNSGIMVHAGAGYLNHRIKIETQTQVVPMIELDYKKGYDRLSTGLCLEQFIGYAFMARSSFYNFYGGLYCIEGFTKERRTLYFDQPDVPVSTKTRLDILVGLKLGWFIPFYSTQKDYYYEY
ncbi:MAG: hypothetical protein ACKO68_07950 [Bacteroidota bacterium]